MISEYNKLRQQLVTILRRIQEIRDSEKESTEILTQLEILKVKARDNEMFLNQNIDTLIRENKIAPKMASSLINDVGFTHSIVKKLLKSAAVLWVKDKQIKELGDEYEY